MSAGDRFPIEALVGTRTLDGRGSFVTDLGNASVVVLRLDGVLYWFQEDPDDGYRSSLSFLEEVNESELPPGGFVAFTPRAVTVRVRAAPAEPYSREDHVLYGVDERTGLIVFEVGTEDIDDYYPTFVNRWTPEGVQPAWLAASPDE